MAKYISAYKCITGGDPYITVSDSNISIDFTNIDENVSGDMNLIMKYFMYSSKLEELTNTFYFISDLKNSISFKDFGLESLKDAIRITPEQSCKNINVCIDKNFIDSNTNILDNIISDTNKFVYSYDDLLVLNIKTTKYVLDFIGDKINLYTGKRVL